MTARFNDDVFISYAHSDNQTGWIAAFARALAAEHTKRAAEPLRVFFDEQIPTGDLCDATLRAGVSAPTTRQRSLKLSCGSRQCSTYCCGGRRARWDGEQRR